MTDRSSVPLTQKERAELESLRAEKARQERAELESLRGEDDDPHLARPWRVATAAAVESARAAGPRTFAQRMVLSDAEDGDGVPTMPPAQKIIIGVCLLCVVVALAWIILSNARII